MCKNYIYVVYNDKVVSLTLSTNNLEDELLRLQNFIGCYDEENKAILKRNLSNCVVKHNPCDSLKCKLFCKNKKMSCAYNSTDLGVGILDILLDAKPKNLCHHRLV